jgi:hypothetical protein
MIWIIVLFQEFKGCYLSNGYMRLAMKDKYAGMSDNRLKFSLIKRGMYWI